MSSATGTPPPHTAVPARLTAEQFARTYDGQHVEYVTGQVRELPMAGGKHGTVCNWIAYYLTAHALANASGRVFTNDTFVKVPQRGDPERVYGADVCFVSFARLAEDVEVPAGVISVTPELVVEVRSPSDSWSDAVSKMLDYLRAGVSVLVILDPRRAPPPCTATKCGQRFSRPIRTSYGRTCCRASRCRSRRCSRNQPNICSGSAKTRR